MLALTHQSQAVWRQLQLTGVYHPDLHSKRLMINIDTSWKQAYQWMTNQLALRIPKPENATIPVWWWPVLANRHDFKVSSPDDILIIADLHEGSYLKSDFQAWHFVLNRMYLPADLYENDAAWEQREKYLESLPPEQQHKLMVKSWQNVFKIEDNDYQITTWNIDLKHVYKVINQDHHLLYKSKKAIQCSNELSRSILDPELNTKLWTTISKS